MTPTALPSKAGVVPKLPLRLVLDDGRELELHTLFRTLPGKRLTGLGVLEGKTVLAKLFIAKTGAQRHWQRECRGLDALRANTLPTPQLLARGQLAEGGYYLFTNYIKGARSPDAADDNDLLTVFRLLGRMHACGLVHEDAHLDNFLLAAEGALIIDGDAIRPSNGPSETLKNLALLFAQLPPARMASLQTAFLSAYGDSNPDLPDMARLEEAIEYARARRLDEYLSKCLRNCSLFQVEKSWDRFVAVPRADADFLAPIIAAPDDWMKAGQPLKQGRTATLSLVEHGGRQIVIKRYNIKSARHALSRSWRASRAWHSWVEAHRLGFLGVVTPKPLALIERRLGPLRGAAWLVTEYCPGIGFSQYCEGRHALDEATLEAIGVLFRQLAAARISHGDLKATNLLWQDGRPVLIDLDATRQHAREGGFDRAWQRDRARFLRNWPEASEVHVQLDEILPLPRIPALRPH